MVNYRLYRIGQAIALSLPLRFAYWLAVFFSDIHHLFGKKDRKVVTENLKVIFPQKDEKEIAKIRIRVFRNFAKYLVDFFRFEKIDSEYIKKNVQIKNLHYFDEALLKGKGAIVLTAHLGNWELGGAIFSISAYPLWAVALEHKDKRINSFFNNRRESRNLHVIAFGRAVRMCLKVLRENKVLALVGDRDFSAKGIVLDFFGKPAHFPEGPASLSLQTGAAIIPGFMLRNADDSYCLCFEKPIAFHSCGDRDKDIHNLISLYIPIFERYIRKYPDQWYMFRRFWIA